MSNSPKERAVKVLYVGGLPRSGSTLTDLILDRLPGHVSVGELFYLFRNGIQLDSLCGCGEAFSSCPFWQEVGQRALGGWDQLPLDAVLKLQARVDRTAAIAAVLSPRQTASFARDLNDYTAILEGVYEAVLAVSGARVVIDSSKRPSMAYILRRSTGVDLTCVHVVRDPRGVAYSFGKVVPLRASSDAESQMPRSRPHKVGRRWVTVNALIGALGRVGVPVVRVRYEDLAADPVTQLGRVARMQGVAADAVDPGFLTPEGLVVTRPHLVAGSRIRLTEGVLPISLDDEWRTAMPTGTRRLVSSMTAVSRIRYGYVR